MLEMEGSEVLLLHLYLTTSEGGEGPEGGAYGPGELQYCVQGVSVGTQRFGCSPSNGANASLFWPII